MGNVSLLRCENSIDIYDLNWNCISNIPISADKFISFKTFSEQASTIVFIIQNEPDERYTVYELQGFSASRTLDITYSKKDESRGFFLLDSFYTIQRKFGHQSKFIGSPSRQKLFFVLNEVIQK